MPNMTLAAAQEELLGATRSYKEIEEALVEQVPGEATPERVIRTTELKGALHDAAVRLIDAKETFARVERETAQKRRERAEKDLADVEAELVHAVHDLETSVDGLVGLMATVLDLSKKRYAYRQEATGRAPRSLLARTSTFGWLCWRLQDLALPDLDTPPSWLPDVHRLSTWVRSRLAELRRLTSRPRLPCRDH